MCLVWNTGPVGRSLRPSPGQLPVCGYQVSPQLPTDSPQEQDSPAMYTHMCGYKFCIGLDANGCDFFGNSRVAISVWSIPGEFDEHLKWPAKLKLIIELINQQGGKNAINPLL